MSTSKYNGLHAPLRLIDCGEGKSEPPPVWEQYTNEPSAVISVLQRENEALRKQVASLQRFQELAYIDPLTGLRNRRYFDERLKEECDRAQRETSSSVSLLVIDIDEFKAINDEQGHVVGDDVLRWLAGFLTTNLRVHDVCCRTGGDEFMVILSHADRSECQKAIRRIKRRLDRAQNGSPFDFKIRLSIGASTWPDDGSNGHDLVKRADEAMYRDKKSRPRSYPNLYPLSNQH